MSVLGVVCMILGVAFIITLLLEIILHDINKIFIIDSLDIYATG